MTVATFDYIIVGAGLAYCVLPNRLSANPRTSVLLVEAGGSARGTAQALAAAVRVSEKLQDVALPLVIGRSGSFTENLRHRYVGPA